MRTPVRLRAERLASIESMPAEAAAGVLLRQDLLRLTASATASAHSEPGTAVAPPCIAASADAHAVSPLEHGLCRLSTNESRYVVARHHVHRRTRRRRLRDRSVGPLDATGTRRCCYPPAGCADARTRAALRIQAQARAAAADPSHPPRPSRSQAAGLSERSAPLTKRSCLTHWSCTSISEESARSSVTRARGPIARRRHSSRCRELTGSDSLGTPSGMAGRAIRHFSWRTAPAAVT